MTYLSVVWFCSSGFLKYIFDVAAFLGIDEDSDGARVRDKSVLEETALLVDLSVKCLESSFRTRRWSRLSLNLWFDRLCLSWCRSSWSSKTLCSMRCKKLLLFFHLIKSILRSFFFHHFPFIFNICTRNNGLSKQWLRWLLGHLLVGLWYVHDLIVVIKK